MATYIKVSRDELYHGGPGSGRYPWGSGDRPYQRLEQAHGGIFRRKRRTTESMRDTLNKAQERIDAHAGKSQEDLRRERSDEKSRRVDEAYDYFRNKREEKNREERPLTNFVKDMNKRAEDAPSSEEAATRWKKTSEANESATKWKKTADNVESAKKSVSDAMDDARRKAKDIRDNLNDDKFESTKKSVSKTMDEVNKKVKETMEDEKTPEKIKNLEKQDKEKKQSKETKEVKRELRDLRTDRQASEMSNADLDEYLNRRRKVDEYNRYRTADKLATINAIDDVVKSGRSAYDSISKSINDKYVAAHKQAKIDKANAELKDMSDDDLQKRVKRMNLEKQYRDLSPEVTIQGEDTTRRILSAIGTTLTVAQIAMPIARGFATSYEPKRR